MIIYQVETITKRKFTGRINQLNEILQKQAQDDWQLVTSLITHKGFLFTKVIYILIFQKNK